MIKIIFYSAKLQIQIYYFENNYYLFKFLTQNTMSCDIKMEE